MHGRHPLKRTEGFTDITRSLPEPATEKPLTPAPLPQSQPPPTPPLTPPPTPVPTPTPAPPPSGPIIEPAPITLWVESEAGPVYAEESHCLERYGDAYREYMGRTPRWIGIPESSHSD